MTVQNIFIINISLVDILLHSLTPQKLRKIKASSYFFFSFSLFIFFVANTDAKFLFRSLKSRKLTNFPGFFFNCGVKFDSVHHISYKFTRETQNWVLYIPFQRINCYLPILSISPNLKPVL